MMKFDRIKTKKTVVVEEEETNQQFAKRIYQTLADEFEGGALYSCTTYNTSADCSKCKMYLTARKTIKNVPTTGETQCAMLAMKYISKHIASKL